MKLESYQEADSDLSMAIKLNKSYWDAYLARGEVRLFYLAQTGKAIPDFSIYITRHSKGAKITDALTYRGFAYFKQGNFRLSENDYRQALTLDRQNGRVYYLLGQTLLELGQQESACQHFSEAYNLGYSAALIEVRGICR